MNQMINVQICLMINNLFELNKFCLKISIEIKNKNELSDSKS